MMKCALMGATAALALSVGFAEAQDKKTFYWVSHGGPADPVWTYFLQGAEAWAAQTGNTVNTSFHSGDVPSQQEAVRAAIAAGAGTLGEFVMKALKRDAGVQYWGNRSSVTGAVGLLDRVAPLCFAAPVFFHSVRWYFSLRT